MLDPAKLAQAIIDEANDGYHHDNANYPPFALTPWDDRIRWTNYIKTCAERVLARELTSQS